MRFVFVMDGLDRVDAEKDTTYGFIQSALGHGHQVLHTHIHQVDYVNGSAGAMVRPLVLDDGVLTFTGPPSRADLAEMDAVFIRKDPPFNSAYLYATLVLEAVRDQTVVVNDPRGLRDANEKLYALQFKEWLPETMVSADRPTILDFVARVGGKAMIKPLDGAGGFGVLALKDGDANQKAIVDLLTLEGSQLAVVQKFVPEAKEGDKRVLMLDGELLGAILRIPAKGDQRANIHVGGTVEPTELTPRELEIVKAVGPQLKADGLFFVGLDLIGERLTEVNVTSPTGIRELSRFMGSHQSDKVINWVEGRVGRG